MSGTRAGWTLLVVEDEEVLRNLYGSRLRESGYCVLEAENGEAALEILRLRAEAAPVDLIVSDISMPKMGGIELAEVVGKEFPGVGMLILTAIGSKDTLVRLLRAGVCEYLDKPVGLDELEAKVAALLGGKARPGALGELRRLHRELGALVDARVEEKNRKILEWLRGGINHRFNQPLSVVMANTEIFGKIIERADLDPVLDEVARASLADLREAAHCLGDLVSMLAQAREVATEEYVGDSRILDLEGCARRGKPS